ncbi:F-box/LRR-repeat protein 5 [Anabrus simplex]|uniref:F-box/LRR-repeat protein 5 n=1 Tax=Anabrus simplex TaxID=316456 RepID=UPI0035A3C2B6
MMAESSNYVEGDTDMSDREDKMNLAYLPYVPLLKVFSYLNVKDRMKCTLVCKTWRNTVLSPQLWGVVNPIQWACGHWEDDICAHSGVEEKMLKEKRLSRVWSKAENYLKLHGNVNDILLPSYFHIHELDTFKGLIQEYKVLSGFIKYLLPHIGTGIQKCVFATSGVTRDCLLNIILLSCPNLTHLDLSFTGIGENAFYGLWEYDVCVNLQYLNFTCCYNLTDKAISNLVKCWTYREEEEEENDDNKSLMQTVTVPSIECDIKQAYKDLMDGDDEMLEPFQSWNALLGSVVRPQLNYKNCKNVKLSCTKGRKRQLAGLRYLNLSGCTVLTDRSLYSLITCKEALKNLQFLDVSGNCFFTSKGLSDLVKWCPSLKPEDLYYCVSLVNGPFRFTANGCSNLQSSTRPCCIPLE